MTVAEGRALALAGGMHVKVVTPRGIVAHEQVDGITAQGALGEFGVLPGHIPLLTMLDAGVLVLDTRAGRQIFAHGPGILEVGARGKVEVLVEQTLPARDVDTAEVSRELSAVEAEMKSLESTDDASWKNLRARRQWATARLAAHKRAS
jgi:F-type H+-transporting ATPase subunit epsilon